MRRQRRFYFLFVFLLPLLFVLQNPRIAEPLRSASLTIFKLVLLVGQSITGVFTGFRDGFGRFWHSFQSQEKLEKRIAELESQVVSHKELARENERLKKLVDFRSAVSGKTIAARVIGWDGTPWRSTVLLDKGSQQGIKKDMAVIVAEGLAGRIVESGPMTARMMLLTDPDSRVSTLTEQSRAQGVSGGNGTGALEMSYLELESGAAVGETVLTSGLGGVFPKGIRVGRIASLGRDASGLHLLARIEPFVQFSKLEEVLCLASSQGK